MGLFPADSSPEPSPEPSLEPSPAVRDEEEEKDVTFYLVRILPPLLVAAVIVVAVAMTAVICWHTRTYTKRRKGVYQCE